LFSQRTDVRFKNEWTTTIGGGRGNIRKQVFLEETDHIKKERGNPTIFASAEGNGVRGVDPEGKKALYSLGSIRAVGRQE